MGSIIASVHIKDNLLTICVGTMEGKKVKEYMENFIQILEKRHNTKVGRFVRQEGCIFNDMFTKGNFHHRKSTGKSFK